MVCEHFRATGAYEAVQGLSDFFTIGLQNDDVQDFDVLWDQALLSASEMPSDVIVEGLYKSKVQDSVQLQTVLALYDHETARHKGTPNYQQLTTAVKLHIDQMMRTRNFRVRNEVVKRGSVTKSQKGKKAHVERKVGEYLLHQKKHGQCSIGNSCSFSHDELEQGDLYGCQRRKGRPSSPTPNSKAKTDDGGENPQKTPGKGDGSSSDKRGEIPCRYKSFQKTRH